MIKRRYYQKDFIINTKIKPICKVSEEHSDYIRNIILLHDGRLASCGDDKLINIYNKNSHKCEISMKGHKDYIYYINQLDDGRIISCSADKSIRFWGISDSTYECLKTINNAHGDIINKVIPLTEHRIASCSDDKSVKIWSDDSYECLVNFNKSKTKIKSILQLKDGRLISSEYQTFPKSVTFWDLSEYEAEISIKNVGCNYPNAISEYEDNKIIICNDNEIKIIDSNSYEIVKSVKIEDISYIYSCLIFKNGNGLFGCNGLLFEYNFNTEDLFYKLNMHCDNIVAIHELYDKIIATASLDRTIKIWIYEGSV